MLIVFAVSFVIVGLVILTIVDVLFVHEIFSSNLTFPSQLWNVIWFGSFCLVCVLGNMGGIVIGFRPQPYYGLPSRVNVIPRLIAGQEYVST